MGPHKREQERRSYIAPLTNIIFQQPDRMVCQSEDLGCTDSIFRGLSYGLYQDRNRVGELL